MPPRTRIPETRHAQHISVPVASRQPSHSTYLCALALLRAAAWRIIEPVYVKRLAERSDDFQVARSKHLGSDDLALIAEAATKGRVGTLLVEADRQIPGTIDYTSGLVQSGELIDPQVDDILDDLAELVLRMKGEVIVFPAERMPTDTGAAATFRY